MIIPVFLELTFQWEEKDSKYLGYDAEKKEAQGGRGRAGGGCTIV